MIAALSTFILRACRFQTRRALSYTEPGPFAAKSLPATSKYATRKERKMIQDIGQQYGCHTCGAGSWLYQLLHRQCNIISFRADHIPPNSFVKRLKQDGKEVKQQFYPQCPHCAMKQSKFCNHVGPKK